MLFSPSPKSRGLQLRISERRLLLMAGDVIAVVIGVFIALRIWALVGQYSFTIEFVFPRSYWFPVLAALWLILASANDFYDLRISANRTTTFRQLILITLQMLLIYGVVFFLSPPLALPRLFILYYGAASFVLIAFFRMLNPALSGWASQRRRVLVVGTDWSAMTIIGVIGRHAHRAYDIIGVVGTADDILSDLCGVPVLGTGKDIDRIIHLNQISELIVTSTLEISSEMFQGVMDAYEAGVSIVPMPLLYERITGQVPVEHVSNDWAVVLPIDGSSLFNPYALIKRTLDVMISLLGMLVFLILLPFIALIIRLDLPGSIFYGQERTGTNGRIFRIYKFRSMRNDAEVKDGCGV